MQVERHEIRVLSAVIEEGGFSRAAERLNVSQSAVSQAIANLEHKLNTALLVRGRVMLANSDSLTKDPDAYGDVAWHVAREQTLGVSQQDRTLPTASRAEMVQELDRALGLGAAGVGIATNIGDWQLHAPEVRDFWREMNRRKLMVLIHPTTPCDAPQNDPGTFLSVGYPGETAMAATKLALTGVLEECPEVRIVWSHLGGGLPMILDRIDRGYQRYSSCPHPPSYYLRRCYFDTACTHGPALQCARATWGGNTLIFGSDVPHVPNTEKETLAALNNTGWPKSELDDIFGATVRRLMAS
jgi:hypothetical protein